jgi:hypothetical protein
VIVTLGYFVLHWPIPDWLKFFALLLSSFGLTTILYEFLVRRNTILRILFGMKGLPSSQAAPIGQVQEAGRTA